MNAAQRQVATDPSTILTSLSHNPTCGLCRLRQLRNYICHCHLAQKLMLILHNCLLDRTHNGNAGCG